MTATLQAVLLGTLGREEARLKRDNRTKSSGYTKTPHTKTVQRRPTHFLTRVKSAKKKVEHKKHEVSEEQALYSTNGLGVQVNY